MSTHKFVVAEPVPSGDEFRRLTELQGESGKLVDSVGWDATDGSHGGCSSTRRSSPNGDEIVFFAYMVPASDAGFNAPNAATITGIIWPLVLNQNSNNLSACQNATGFRPTGYQKYVLIAGHLNATAGTWSWLDIEFTHSDSQGTCFSRVFDMKENVFDDHEEGFFTMPFDMGNGYKYSIYGADCDDEYGFQFNFNDFYQ